MSKEFQDKNWNNLSEESKKQIIDEYRCFKKIAEISECKPEFVGSYREIESFFGKHNLDNYNITMENKETITVDRKIFDCLTWLSNRVAECYEYRDNWSDEFVKKEVIEFFEMFKKELTEEINWTRLTEEEMRILRFSKWELVDGRDIWLIPLYLFSQLPLGAKVWCIDGRQYINDGKTLDNDVRYGCTAYGIIPGQFEIVPEEEWEEFNKKQKENYFKKLQEYKIEMLNQKSKD